MKNSIKNITCFIIIIVIITFVSIGCSKLKSTFLNEYEERGCRIEGENQPKTAFDYINRATKHKEKSQSDCQFYACQQAVNLDPNDARVYFCRGISYYDYKKDYLNAINDLTTAIQMQPTGYEGYSNYSARANIHEKEAQFEKALADYQKAFELSIPADKPFVKFNIAEIYLKQNKLDLALTAINDALGQNSTSSNFYFLRAEIYRKLGKTDAADADEKKALEIKNKE